MSWLKDKKEYLVQDDSEGPYEDDINLTDEELKHVEDLKKQYGLK